MKKTNPTAPLPPEAHGHTATPLAPYPRPAVAWYATVLMALLYWISLLDRTIISLMVDPIKRDLGISDVQFGMLHGLAFAITFCVFGLAAGALADRVNRRRVIYLCVTIWSLATAACGVAQNFFHMMIARVAVGVGEAGLNPCATSMITDLFPKHRLTLALAVYSMGASVGAGCAFLFGGMLIEFVNQQPILTVPIIGEFRAWQAVFFIIGLPGVLIAFSVLSIPEPLRRGVRSRPLQASTGLLQSYRDLMQFITERPQFFLYHFIGFGLASMGFAGGNAWYAAHLARNFGWGAGDIGLGLGLAMIVAGLLGKTLSGLAVDELFSKGYRDAQFRWYASCLVLATPIAIYASTSDDVWIFLSGIALMVMLLSPLTALYVAALNLVTPNELRGVAVALYSALAGLIALSLGPIVIAAASDYLYGGDQIGAGLATLYAISYPAAAWALWKGRHAMHNAVEEAASWTDGGVEPN